VYEFRPFPLPQVLQLKTCGLRAVPMQSGSEETDVPNTILQNEANFDLNPVASTPHRVELRLLFAAAGSSLSRLAGSPSSKHIRLAWSNRRVGLLPC
jgi:hypothetical protein